ncbi:MAG: DUF308 domain-containing protein [Clostridia bacterium]|nr:DUF308 domain-containing protein [Clostridia bacterium]
MKKANTGRLLTYLGMGVLGLLLILFRREVDTWLFRAAGIGLIVIGALSLIGNWPERKSMKQTFLAESTVSLAMIGVGIWLLCNPRSFKNTLNFLVGAVLIAIGVMMFLRGRKTGGKQSDLLVAGSVVLLGVIVIVFHLVTKLTGWAIIACGVALIYTAVTGVFSTIGRKA